MFRNNTLSILSDEELLNLHKESDKTTYIEELFIRYLPLLYGVSLKYLKDSDKARDAVMQLLENLFDKISDFEINEFRPWIYSVIKNHCLQIQRKEAHFIAADFSDGTTEFDDIMRLLEKNQNEQPAMLTNCLNKLPERQRLSLNYFFKDELSYAEIVDKTGYTLKNVKNYIQNAKQNLKICMENIETNDQ